MSGWPERALVVLGALAGLAGVALSALAAHLTGGGSLDVAARFLLVHAPALMALPALTATGTVRPPVARLAGAVLAAGLVVFCGDLALRALAGWTPWRLLAPTGGVLLMAGWALAALAALLARPRLPSTTP